MGEKKPDFGGWATKNDLECSDGLTIKQGAFSGNHGTTVPLMWSHRHESPAAVLGHAQLIENHEGIYANGFFNETSNGIHAKEMVRHGDIQSLSIHARRVKKNGYDVVHGEITEVSLVMKGANPGAYIDQSTFAHEDGSQSDEVIIYTGYELEHTDESSSDDAQPVQTESEGGDMSDSTEPNKTAKEIFDAMTDEQKKVVYMVAEEVAIASVDVEDGEEEDDSEEEVTEHGYENEETLYHNQEDNKMSRNVFDRTEESKPSETLSHSQMEAIFNDARRMGSLKESVLSHANEYGITNIDILFPDAKTISDSPEIIKRRTEWVSEVIGKTKHSPFSRVKNVLADFTADEARALGYVKNSMKKEEIISLMKRVTTPTTIYKKQKLDRDDITDITDFNVVSWIKAEMRIMLDEEIARAVLLGDGRSGSSEDKILDPKGSTNGAGIRAIVHDDDMFAHKVTVNDVLTPGAIVESILRSRTHYRGSGSPTLYTTDGVLVDMLLEKDKIGRRLYNSVEELANVLRVAKIVPVEVMEQYPTILGIMVNMQDYTLGTDRGGEISMFDDFDIDWNQHKYLMETRLSGALVKYKSAIVFSRTEADEVVPTMPSFDSETNTITIPDITGVSYSINDDVVTGSVVIEENTTVEAYPTIGYVFPTNINTSWTFTYNGN